MHYCIVQHCRKLFPTVIRDGGGGGRSVGVEGCARARYAGARKEPKVQEGIKNQNREESRDNSGVYI